MKKPALPGRVSVSACRPADRKMLATPAGKALVAAAARLMEVRRAQRGPELDDLIKAVELATGDLADAVARDCDRFGLNHSKWWKAVKRVRRLLAARQ